MATSILDQRPAYALAATRPSIARLLAERRRAMTQDENTSDQKKGEKQTSDVNETQEGDTTSSSQKTLELSARPLSGSNKRWRQPTNVRELASQINDVATMVLNDQIDFAQAQLYSTLARTLAQATSIEVTRSRFLKEAPDLTFDVEDES